MKNLITFIMKQKFDTQRFYEEIEEIVDKTMEELYHVLAHEVLNEYNAMEIFKEIASEECELPF